MIVIRKFEVDPNRIATILLTHLSSDMLDRHADVDWEVAEDGMVLTI